MNTVRVIIEQYEYIGVAGRALCWEFSYLVGEHLVGGRATGGEEVVGSGAGVY